ncbi:uncharacterized protein N7500_001112 [Penicillium coprophilum]|uniref:uncharacterized protein n=1 Tax=Penicillium coprophilum TaxID=36646 RepID=UPI002390E7EA|nr:uncharacterized protein N7500_001112 [Penicillium coprophilum]KAJ5178413.1 hypothetical protein N7500_001112 [Penicillium coprophilum]
MWKVALVVGLLVVVFAVAVLALWRAPQETYRGVDPIQAATSVWVWNTTRPFGCGRRRRYPQPLFIQHDHESRYVSAPINLDAGPTMLEEQAAPETPAAPTTTSLVYWGLNKLVTQCKVLFAQVYPSAAGMKPGEQATTETPAASSTDVTMSGGLSAQQDAPNRSGQQTHGQINEQSTAAAKSTPPGPQVDGSGSSDNLISNAPQADDMTPQGRSTIRVAREYLIPARIGSSPLRVINIFPGETLVGQSTESVAPANQAPTDQTAIERASRMFADTVKAVLSW